jgi:hypothetical protein
MVINLKRIAIAIVKTTIHFAGTVVIRPFLFIFRKQISFDSQGAPVILFVSLAFRGDLVLTFPTIRALKSKYPKSKIVLWTRDYNRFLAKLNQDIDSVIVYDRFSSRGLAAFKEIFLLKRHRSFFESIKTQKYTIKNRPQ